MKRSREEKKRKREKRREVEKRGRGVVKWTLLN